MAKIKIDEKALQKLVEPAIKGFEKDLNRIRVSHSGRPVSEVERALKAAAKKHGLEPGRDARKLAQDISAGTA